MNSNATIPLPEPSNATDGQPRIYVTEEEFEYLRQHPAFIPYRPAPVAPREPTAGHLRRRRLIR